MRAGVLLCFLVIAACGGSGDTPPAPPTTVEPASPDPVEAPPTDDEAEAEAPPAPVVPTVHELLVLLVPEGTLLPSEQRLGEFLETRMRRNHRDVELRAATEEEAALGRALLDHGATSPSPATFGAARRVLFLRFAPPRTLSDGDLRTGGIDAVVLLHVPSTTPAFEARIEAGWRLENDRWADWLAGLLRDAEGA